MAGDAPGKDPAGRRARVSHVPQTVLVTGSTAGMGRYLATLLAEMGWTVLAHGRDKKRLDELVTTVPGNVVPLRADLSSLAQVDKLAATVRKKTKRLHVLVNNAGVGFGAPDEERQLSADGHELRLAVNYLAPVLLTRRLVPLLAASAPSRVVNVGSLGQEPMDRDDIEMTEEYSGVQAYRRAKLALAAFTFDLADELRGSGVTVNCIHPATFMATTMVLDSGISPRSSIADGGDATLRLITDPSLARTTGDFFDGNRAVAAHRDAYDTGFRRWLRRQTDAMLPAV